MSDWRPIETAPKDGTWILVREPPQPRPPDALSHPEVHVVRWGIPEWRGGEKTWVTMALGSGPDTYNVYDAMLWMPLPSSSAG